MPDIVLIRLRAAGPGQDRRVKITGIDKFFEERRPLDNPQFDVDPNFPETALNNLTGFRAQIIPLIGDNSESQPGSILVKNTVTIGIDPASLC